MVDSATVASPYLASFCYNYENNWPFARNYLCRKFVKGVFPDPESIFGDLQEDEKLMKYQMFLNSSVRREDLDFSYFGLGVTSNSARTEYVLVEMRNCTQIFTSPY